MNALVEALAAVWALKWVVAFIATITAGVLWAVRP